MTPEFEEKMRKRTKEEFEEYEQFLYKATAYKFNL